jgi:simple sugar transport system permease protein
MSSDTSLPILVAFIASTLRISTPLIFTALGGVITERAGVVNIGLEGMMITGAFFGVIGSQYTSNPWMGMLIGIVAGGLMALLHAFLSISLKADQVISGTAINTFSPALASILLFTLLNRQGQTDGVKKIAYTPEMRNFLLGIPVIGRFLTELNYYVFIALALVAVVNFVLFHTVWGMRLRAVGEHPKAADTLGINVYRTRYIAVVLSGMLAALGGASLSIGTNNLFREGMTNGRGFIALAAMIFGNWKPGGALLAALLFGAAEASQIIAQRFGLPIPNEFYYALPYLMTMIAVTGFAKKSRPPLSVGLPYDKGSR